jgi:hypothetical protein
VAHGFKAGGHQIGIAQHCGQDGEMGHGCHDRVNRR